MSEPTDAQKLGVGCGFFLVVGLVAAVWSLFTDGDSDADEPSGPTNEAAIDVCEQSIEEKLKAPATASFSGATATNPGSDLEDFEVTGFVDAENSFGANIRSTWWCAASWIDGTRWSVTAVLNE